MNKSYIVCAPPIDPVSAGLQAMHKLKADLILYGQSATLLHPWAPYIAQDNEIVIYPDHHTGNPFQAKNVVRYLLGPAGFFGGDQDFPETNLMYYYSYDLIHGVRDPHNILSIPTIKEDRFPRKREGRSGSCYMAKKYAGIKGGKPWGLPDGCIPILPTTNVEGLFSRIKTFITFDFTALNIEALMCGIDVDWRFNEYFKQPFNFGGYFSYDIDKIQDSYAEMVRRYINEQLPTFIKRTQEHFS